VNLRDAVQDHTVLAETFRNSVYGQRVAAIPDDVTGKSITQKAKAAHNICFGSEGNHTGFGIQMRELCKRSINNVIREPILLKARIFQTLFMGILAGLIFLRLPNSLTGASDKVSGAFFIAVNPLMSGINGPTATFPPERAVYWRENGGGLLERKWRRFIFHRCIFYV